MSDTLFRECLHLDSLGLFVLSNTGRISCGSLIIHLISFMPRREWDSWTHQPGLAENTGYRGIQSSAGYISSLYTRSL